MTTDPMAPRCSARSKQTGEQCKQRPVQGGTVCRFHGGSAPQVKAAAEQRDLEQKADAEVRKLWVGLDQATPVKDPVASLERMAGALESAVDMVGAKVNDLGNLAGGTGLTQLRGEVVLLERLLGQLRQALDAMARLGIAERHVELEQERAQLVTAGVLAVLELMHRELPGGLSPDLRSAALQVFITAIGRGPEVLEGATA